MLKILKLFQRFIFGLVYFINRIFLRIIGVRYGHNLETFSASSIEAPYNLRIGDNVWIGKNCSFYCLSGVTIGDNVLIAKDVSIISNDHNFSDRSIPIVKQGISRSKNRVTIGDNVWIGEKSIILKNVSIGEGAVVGAGSVVTKNVPPFAIVAGNPARIIKMRRK